MIKSGLVKIVIASLLSVCVTFSLFAGFWDWTQPYKGPKRDIINLRITANYRDTLLLAQVAQYHSKQPFILLPAKGQNQIFFWPARQDTAMEIAEADLTRFISFLNPQRIIVIGGTNVVPEKYLNMIPRDQTVVVIYNQDWQKVAETLNFYLRETNISNDFSRLRAQLSGPLYVPTAPNKSAESAVPATTEKPIVSVVNPADQKQPAEYPAKIVRVKDVKDAKDAEQEDMPKNAPVLIESK